MLFFHLGRKYVSNLRNDVSKLLISELPKLNNLKKYYNLYTDNNIYNYNNNVINEDIYIVDVNSFNLQFLIYLNSFFKNQELSAYINQLQEFNKIKRVVEFGYLFKSINSTIKLNKYMISFRNLIFQPFIEKYQVNSRMLNLYRMNYDDIEFNTIDSEITEELYVHPDFLNVVKLKHFDYVISLNKSDGIYYIVDNKVIDIKYTSGWVDIPAYRYIINIVIEFILNKQMTMKELNDKIYNYIEFASNDDFFGYEEDDISKEYKPTDIVPQQIKYLFVAKVISKFLILFK
jgi:hypothetical protein